MVKIIGKSAKRVRKPKTKAKPHTNSPKILKPTATSPLRPKGAGKCAAVSEKCCNLSSPWLANVNPNTRRDANKISDVFVLSAFGNSSSKHFISYNLLYLYVLPMVPCRPTLLYKRDYVENSTAVISLIDYKDRDKFPFYPNNTPESLSKATKKYHLCGIDLQRLCMQQFLSFHICKTMNPLHRMILHSSLKR